jgi:hypothetical protein
LLADRKSGNPASSTMIRTISLLAFLLSACFAQAELNSAQLAGETPPPPETFVLASGKKRYVVSYPKEEIRVELVSHGPSPLKTTLLMAAKPPTADSVSFPSDDVAKLPQLGGAAIWQDRLVCCLTRESCLIFIDLKTARITSRQSLPDFPAPRAAAYDPSGKLWMFSGNSLTEIAFTSDGHFNPIHHQGDFDQPEHLVISREGKFYIAERGAQPRMQMLSPDRTSLWMSPFTDGHSCYAITIRMSHPRFWTNSHNAFVVP